jgi:DNA-binding transcriptional ArsR family regulator
MKDVSQSLLSHHLADLRGAGLVESEKRGLKVYYKLTEKGSSITNNVLLLPINEGEK